MWVAVGVNLRIKADKELIEPEGVGQSLGYCPTPSGLWVALSHAFPAFHTGLPTSLPFREPQKRIGRPQFHFSIAQNQAPEHTTQQARTENYENS